MLWNVLFNLAVIVTVLHQSNIASSLNRADTLSPVDDLRSAKGRRNQVLIPGGCNSQLEVLKNGQIRCSVDSGCIAICDNGYKFPNGETQLAIACTNKKWHPFKTNLESIPDCELLEKRLKTCITWGGKSYKTFDDTIYNFHSQCSYILVQETQGQSFTVTVQNSPICKEGKCFRIIKIYLSGRQYILQRNAEGAPQFTIGENQISIPAKLPGLQVKKHGQFIVATLDSLGIQLKWDGASMLQVDALESIGRKLSGLCGNKNGDKYDDLMINNDIKTEFEFANFWRERNYGETCYEYLNTKHSCEVVDPQTVLEAVTFCSKLFFDQKFMLCVRTMDFVDFLKACQLNYCFCEASDKRTCACNTMDAHIRQCASKNVVSSLGWRNHIKDCPLTCSGGRLYVPCAPKIEATCFTEREKETNMEDCEEGCVCPEGTVLHQNKCIRPDQCPCERRGFLFEPGKEVPSDCNTCTCTAGKWICTNKDCSGKSTICGDPHYTTFDGKHYDFMGRCKYYLMKGDDYSLIGENVPCAGGITEDVQSQPPDAPSCTKSVTVNYKDFSVDLKHQKKVSVNGFDITIFPVDIGGIRIRVASSEFLVVDLPNGVNLEWNGNTRLHVKIPPEFFGKTRGLLGTFNRNQTDDFMTPEGIIEESSVSFANKWKVDGSCSDASEVKGHPCDLNAQKKADAEKYCSYLLHDIFADCHPYVNPDAIYQDCLYDMCSCKIQVESCLCPMLATYAKDCAATGIKLLWQEKVQECKVQCPANQIYQICGNSCTRSCADISSHKNCIQECVEGCNCPEGQTLDSHGKCIPIEQCPCTYGELEFKVGDKKIRPGKNRTELCTCAGGIWACEKAKQNEIQTYPTAEATSEFCLTSNHQEFTDCAPVEPRTCDDMQKSLKWQKPLDCKPGCVCMSGYVLDTPGGKCIIEEACACQSKREIFKIVEYTFTSSCAMCTCSTTGKWGCVDAPCPACKIGDKEYLFGEVWQPDPKDSCTLMECILDEYNTKMQKKVLECNTVCAPGFEYQQSHNKSINCCGQCIPKTCFYENRVRNVGEEWFSLDFCTKYTCKSNNGSIYVEAATKDCSEIDPREESEFEIEKQHVKGQCCLQFVKTGCRYNETVYMPGEKWKSLEDKCTTEICALDLRSMSLKKYKQVEVCNKNCAPGWTYEEEEDECCGKCKQTHCVVGKTLYEPDSTWTSNDNCTSFSCIEDSEQLYISNSTIVCPDISNCPENAIYTDSCCPKCNKTLNKTLGSCGINIKDPRSTIGIFQKNSLCKNLEPIEGLTECTGGCESKSFFDIKSWKLAVDCKCCREKETKKLSIELTCKDGKKYMEKIDVPASCECFKCEGVTNRLHKSPLNPAQWKKISKTWISL